MQWVKNIRKALLTSYEPHGYRFLTAWTDLQCLKDIADLFTALNLKCPDF